MKKILFIAFAVIIVFANTLMAQNTIVDGARKYQTIHGLGVNINPQSWNVNPEAVKKVIGRHSRKDRGENPSISRQTTSRWCC